MTKVRDNGFTLIEALVAMAVLALGAVSLLSAAESHTARISDVTDRIVARWGAQYRMAEIQLGLPQSGGPVEMYGQRLTITTQTEPTNDPDLSRVTLQVAGGNGGGPLYLLDGYIGTGEAP